VEEQTILLRIRAGRKLSPRKAQELRRKLVRIVSPLNVRISGDIVELTIFKEIDRGVAERIARAIDESCAKIEEITRPKIWKKDPSHMLDAYHELLIRNRFWEAHVAGEAIWRNISPLGKHLAALAGAYAKAQEGLLDPALTILEKAVHELRGLVDEECLRGELYKVYESGRGEPWRCIFFDRIREALLKR
jgi:hypothetical protein